MPTASQSSSETKQHASQKMKTPNTETIEKKPTLAPPSETLANIRTFTDLLLKAYGPTLQNLDSRWAAVDPSCPVISTILPVGTILFQAQPAVIWDKDSSASEKKINVNCGNYFSLECLPGSQLKKLGINPYGITNQLISGQELLTKQKKILETQCQRLVEEKKLTPADSATFLEDLEPGRQSSEFKVVIPKKLFAYRVKQIEPPVSTNIAAATIAAEDKEEAKQTEQPSTTPAAPPSYMRQATFSIAGKTDDFWSVPKFVTEVSGGAHQIFIPKPSECLELIAVIDETSHSLTPQNVKINYWPTGDFNVPVLRLRAKDSSILSNESKITTTTDDDLLKEIRQGLQKNQELLKSFYGDAKKTATLENWEIEFDTLENEFLNFLKSEDIKQAALSLSKMERVLNTACSKEDIFFSYAKHCFQLYQGLIYYKQHRFEKSVPQLKAATQFFQDIKNRAMTIQLCLKLQNLPLSMLWLSNTTILPQDLAIDGMAIVNLVYPSWKGREKDILAKIEKADCEKAVLPPAGSTLKEYEESFLHALKNASNLRFVFVLPTPKQVKTIIPMDATVEQKKQIEQEDKNTNRERCEKSNQFIERLCTTLLLREENPANVALESLEIRSCEQLGINVSPFIALLAGAKNLKEVAFDPYYYSIMDAKEVAKQLANCPRLNKITLGLFNSKESAKKNMYQDFANAIKELSLTRPITIRILDQKIPDENLYYCFITALLKLQSEGHRISFEGPIQNIYQWQVKHHPQACIERFVHRFVGLDQKAKIKMPSKQLQSHLIIELNNCFGNTDTPLVIFKKLGYLEKIFRTIDDNKEILFPQKNRSSSDAQLPQNYLEKEQIKQLRLLFKKYLKQIDPKKLNPFLSRIINELCQKSQLMKTGDIPSFGLFSKNYRSYRDSQKILSNTTIRLESKRQFTLAQ